jgi:hypothetical protein
VAPPTLVVAVAVGLGTIDMPVPSVEEWEWLNWKFPRPIHAGDTIYARWTLTQKRPPIGAAPTAVVVWRVDVHTADGALCAEGEVGAKVRRQVGSRDGDRARAPEAVAAPAVPGAPRRRRRRRPAGANGPAPEATAITAPPAPVAKPERAAGAPRRRRRRRPATGSSPRDAEPAVGPVPAPEPAPAPPPAATPAASRGGLGRVIRRLRPGNRES